MSVVYYRRVPQPPYDPFARPFASPLVYLLAFEYDRRVVDFVKTVPPAHRSYNPATRRWRVSEDGLVLLSVRADAWGVRLRRIDEPPASPRPLQGNGRTWADELLTACPAPLRAAVFRALAGALHPDHGGDVELMKTLNVAREALDQRERVA